MAVHHKFPPPVSLHTHDPQLGVLTGQAGGASGIHTQNLRSGIAVFCREEKQRQKVIICTKMYFVQVDKTNEITSKAFVK